MSYIPKSLIATVKRISILINMHEYIFFFERYVQTFLSFLYTKKKDYEVNKKMMHILPPPLFVIFYIYFVMQNKSLQHSYIN